MGCCQVCGCGSVTFGLLADALCRPWRKKKVLVVGSINVDLFVRAQDDAVMFSQERISLRPVKGMTLPAKSLVAMPAVGLKGVAPGGEEAFILTMGGPFEQKTGGKGANAAAAAGQTFACDFFRQHGRQIGGGEQSPAG